MAFDRVRVEPEFNRVIHSFTISPKKIVGYFFKETESLTLFSYLK